MSRSETKDRFVLIGGGGHAAVVAEAAMLATNAGAGSAPTLAGFLDDNPDARIFDLARLGGLDAIEAISGGWILALGELTLRADVLARLSGLQAGARSVVHPRSFVSPSGAFGAGVFVGPMATVHARARVGAHAIVNAGAVVEHDVEVGVNTHVAPGAVLGGGVSVGAHTLMGLGCRVLPGVRIGSRCVVGAGAVVATDVPDETRVAGVPAREL